VSKEEKQANNAVSENKPGEEVVELFEVFVDVEDDCNAAGSGQHSEQVSSRERIVGCC